MKVNLELCRGYQTRLFLTEKTGWKETYLPGTEMPTEREKKIRTWWLHPAVATKGNKLQHLHSSGKSHTFVKFLQWQI